MAIPKNDDITYFGTADDVVARYPWKTHSGVESMNDQLLNAAIYGKKLAINDGYIIANQSLLPSLLNLNRSLLGAMLQSDTACLFSRSADRNIAEGLEKGASSIETHKSITSSKDWPKYRDQLEVLQSAIQSRTLTWPTDKNMSAIFVKCMEVLFNEDNLSNSMEEELKRPFTNIYKRVTNKLNKNFDAARSVWEEECWRFYNGVVPSPYDPNISKLKNYDKVRVLMNIANEAYHIAYSCGLSISPEATNIRSARPLTALCPSYSDLFVREEHHEFNLGNLSNLHRYLINIKCSDYQNGADYSWIQELYQDIEFRESRADYLESLRRFLHGEITEKTMASSKTNYLNEIIDRSASGLKHSKSYYRTSATTALGVVFGAGLSRLTESPDIASVISTVGGLFIGLYCDRYGNGVYHDCIVNPAFRKKFGAARPSTLEKNKHFARDLGLINVKLDKRVVNKLLADIKPYQP